ncbi:MAG: sigma-70 family RNA polymerase sigma factor [Planctomycetota bacterium]|nr:sigma-70 family RNA polymerase sigma factor [Planctomycetota bacterium]
MMTLTADRSYTYDDLTETSIVDLVSQAQAGDRAAMDQIYCRFQQHVLSIAYKKLGNWDEAQELSQDVFIQAFRRLDQLQVPEAFGGWLRQIVHRMAINRATRRPTPTSVDHEILEATVTCDSDPLEAVLTREQKMQVHQGLNRLGDLDRQTLVAFYLDGQSLNQMSDAFAAPIGTIKRRLHVARKRLAKECEMMQAV